MLKKLDKTLSSKQTESVKNENAQSRARPFVTDGSLTDQGIRNTLELQLREQGVLADLYRPPAEPDEAAIGLPRELKHALARLFYDVAGDFSGAALRVLLVLLANRLTGRRVGTVNRLSKTTQLSKRQTQRGLAELKKRDLVTVTPIPQREGSNKFVLNVELDSKKTSKKRDKNVTPGGDKSVAKKEPLSLQK